MVGLSGAVSTGISLDLRDEGELAALVVTEHVDLGDVADIAALGFHVGVVQNNEFLTGKPFDGHAELTIPQPDYYPRFAHLLPNVRFGQPQGQIVFRAAYQRKVHGRHRPGNLLVPPELRRQPLQLRPVSIQP